MMEMTDVEWCLTYIRSCFLYISGREHESADPECCGPTQRGHPACVVRIRDVESPHIDRNSKLVLD